MIGEHRHGHLGVKSLVYFFITCTISLHRSVTIRLLDGTLYASFHIATFKVGTIREIRRCTTFCLKLWLQVFAHLRVNSLLCILLHTRVDGCIYLQAISVNVIRTTITFIILFAPTIQGVCFPHERILIVLLTLPIFIIRWVGFLGHHDTSQIFADVCTKPLFMVNTMEVQFQRFLTQGCILCFREFASLYHLLQHYITAFATTIRFTNRIEVRRVFTHADQRGALGNGKVFGRFSEINVRRRLYAYCIMQKIEIIEIECQYLFLGIMTFKFYCNHPFHRFLHESLHGTLSRRRIQLLRKLLCNGTTTTSTLMPQNTAFNHRTEHCSGINA